MIIITVTIFLFLLFHLYVPFEKSGVNLTVLPLEDVCFLCFEALGTFWSSNSNAFIRICLRKIILGQLYLGPGRSARCVTRLLWAGMASSIVGSVRSLAWSVFPSCSCLSATCSRTPVTYTSFCVPCFLHVFSISYYIFICMYSSLLSCHLHPLLRHFCTFLFLLVFSGFPFHPLAHVCFQCLKFWFILKSHIF